jgi:hypothetical protein
VTVQILPAAQERALVDAVRRRGVLRYRVLAATNVQWALVNRGLATRRMGKRGPVFRLSAPGRSVSLVLANWNAMKQSTHKES